MIFYYTLNSSRVYVRLQFLGPYLVWKIGWPYDFDYLEF